MYRKLATFQLELRNRALRKRASRATSQGKACASVRFAVVCAEPRGVLVVHEHWGALRLIFWKLRNLATHAAEGLALINHPRVVDVFSTWEILLCFELL